MGGRGVKLTQQDRDIVEAFENFLSWGERPRTYAGARPLPWSVPPAWFAYATGLTEWCPPKGEL
jgi:hypothetical protein